MNLRVESLQILREILLVTRHRLAIHCRRGASLQPAKRPFQCGWVVNPVLLSLLAASLTRARFAGRATRLCVRTPATSRSSPSGRPLPSAHLVSFGGIIGTMSRSESQPRLGAALCFSLALRPRR